MLRMQRTLRFSSTSQVWVIVVSHLIAIQLQNLSARLGLVTGEHLAQVCRQQYPRLVCWLLWLLCEARPHTQLTSLLPLYPPVWKPHQQKKRTACR